NANLSERNIAIERGELITHSGGKHGGIGKARTHYDRDEGNRNLRGPKIHFRREIFFEWKKFYVPNHADHLTHLVVVIADAPAWLDAFTDHILPWKKFLGETLIHYDDGKRVKLVRFRENSTLQKRDAHGLEIIHPCDARGSIVPLSFRHGVLFDVEISCYITSSQRQG